MGRTKMGSRLTAYTVWSGREVGTDTLAAVAMVVAGRSDEPLYPTLEARGWLLGMTDAGMLTNDECLRGIARLNQYEGR